MDYAFPILVAFVLTSLVGCAYATFRIHRCLREFRGVATRLLLEMVRLQSHAQHGTAPLPSKLEELEQMVLTGAIKQKQIEIEALGSVQRWSDPMDQQDEIEYARQSRRLNREFRHG